MIWLALCSSRKAVWMRRRCSCVLWMIVAITFLCVSIPCVFLMIQAIVWRGDQSDSLINSSRTAELELEKRDRFLEGIGSYWKILRAKREVLTYVLCCLLLFFLPLGSIVPLFYINPLCPLILLPSYLASLPAFVMSFVCVLSSFLPVLAAPLSTPFFGVSGPYFKWEHQLSDSFLKALGSPNNTHYGNETVTRCHRCIISNYFHTFNYSTTNSCFVWWDLQITACLLICCGPYCFPVLEIKLQNFAWCFWGIEVWLMSSSL